MRRIALHVLAVLLAAFILPALAHLAVWAAADRPRSWSTADWSSAGILSKPAVSDATVLIYSARTGGLKGAFSTHSWIVLKRPGEAHYERFDVVGWGRPVRRNGWAADARWYSNDPVAVFEAKGAQARALLPKIDAAIRDYQWSAYGDYTIWPGPNSNTFVASIIRAVPGLDIALPSTAVGRDFPEDGRWFRRASTGDWHLSLGGFAGVVAGPVSGFELNFLGLVVGYDPRQARLKIPAFGAVDL